MQHVGSDAVRVIKEMNKADMSEKVCVPYFPSSGFSAFLLTIQSFWAVANFLCS